MYTYPIFQHLVQFSNMVDETGRLKFQKSTPAAFDLAKVELGGGSTQKTKDTDEKAKVVEEQAREEDYEGGDKDEQDDDQSDQADDQYAPNYSAQQYPSQYAYGNGMYQGMAQ